MPDLPIIAGTLLVVCQYFGHTVESELNNNVDAIEQRNTRFANADSLVLNSFIDVSYAQCIRECDSRPGCKGVEYRYSAKYCSLRTAISTTVVTPGALTVSGFDETVQCGDIIKCLSNEACEENTGKCNIKECGHPGFTRDFQGNRFGLGGRIRYACSVHYGEQICTDKGKWETVHDSLDTYQGLTCRDIRQVNPSVKSGFYRNRLNMTIYCDFVTRGGDWLVFQRRLDGSLDFYRTWEEYKIGFGDVCGEFWLGLENVYRILRASPATQFQLRIDLEDWDGDWAYASYSFFDLDNEVDGYRLHISTTASGTAGDSLNAGPNHNGRMFTTYDRDNDLSGENCAVKFHGAWWYNACHDSNLNGRYYTGGHTTNYASGVTWRSLKGQYYSFRRTEMKMSEIP